MRPSHTQNRAAYLLLLPTLLLLAVVIGYPIIAALIHSFQADPGLDPATGLFVNGGFAGFDNYLHWLLQRCAGPDGTYISCPDGNLASNFYASVGITFFFAVATVSLELVFGMWMAIIMNRNFRGRGLVRAAILVPWAIPTAVSAKLAYFIFAPTGIVNAITGTETLWTTAQWASRAAIIITDTWKTTPFMALLILAGLQLIPEEVYEAAKMDGTTTVQRFMSITLPLARPALIVAILFRTLDALRMYDLPAIFNGGGGGSGHATTTLSILVVNQVKQGYNSASALSTITFLIIFLVAIVFIRFLGADITGTGRVSRRQARRDRREQEELARLEASEPQLQEVGA
ncbi:carbohydrate ABC transporter permease [Cellulomonas sp. McL0617]|uniref:carbohydrate ABC transporter permease n=1 Tax=Cellulomonas sp. McL0617 TaxID=3415675 RepID=UPI003CEA039E